jgi:hypothetical protein
LASQSPSSSSCPESLMRSAPFHHRIIHARKYKYSLLESLVYCRTRRIPFMLVPRSVAQKYEVWKRSSETWKRESTKIRTQRIRPSDTRIHSEMVLRVEIKYDKLERVCVCACDSVCVSCLGLCVCVHLTLRVICSLMITVIPG